MTPFITIEEKLNAFLFDTEKNILKAMFSPNFNAITTQNTIALVKQQTTSPTSEETFQELLDSLIIENNKRSVNVTQKKTKEPILSDIEKSICFDMAEEHFHNAYTMCYKLLNEDFADIELLKELSRKKAALFSLSQNEIQDIVKQELIVFTCRNSRILSFYVYRELMLLSLDNIIKYSI